MKPKKEIVHQGTIPSAKNLFYYNWAIEFPKEDIETANYFLNLMLTFSIALFSIVVAFGSNIEKSFQPYILASLIISVAICFLGNLPIEKKYNPHIVETIESAIKEIIKTKRFYVILSASFVFLSMVLIFLNVLTKLF